MKEKGISSAIIIVAIVIIIAAVGVGGYLLLKGLSGPDFELSANPTSISIPQGSSENVTITIRSINGFSSKIWTSRLTKPGGWIDTTLDFPSRTPPPNGEIDGTLAIEISSAAPIETIYTITITGDENSDHLFQPSFRPPSHHTVEITVTVIPGGPSSGDKPIYIVGNGDFTPANGVTSGSGTADDPYIIENKNISTVGGTDGIVIINTTAYFIIRNSYVHGGGDEIGIYFLGVVNGKIENCIIVNTEIGIDLAPSTSLSKNNTVNNNTCENNTIGIDLGRSDNNLISNNTCSNNEYHGIDLGDSPNNTLDNNTCQGNGGDGIGIRYPSSNNNLITNNTCSNNSGNGIKLWDSSNNILDNNICSNNNDGIELNGANYTLTNNTLSNNTCGNNFRGIYLRNCYNNLIYHNNFVNNGTQTVDDGSNYWDDGYPSGGNYWSDYAGSDANDDGIGDTPYDIPGDNNQDRYPLMNPKV